MVNDLEAITSDFCIDDDFWRKVSCRSKREEEESDLIRKFSLCSSLTVTQDLSLSSFLETRERKKKESRKRRYLKTKHRSARILAWKETRCASDRPGSAIAISAILDRGLPRSPVGVEQKGVGRKFSIDPWRCFEVRALRQHCGGGAPRCLRRRRQQARRNR